MPTFPGFPSGKVHLTPIPATFFSDLLPEIDHLGELKVVLYALWRLDRMEGNFRYLKETDFWGDARFLQGMGKDPVEARRNLQEALEQAVIRGVLLRVTVELGERATLYFFNSPKGRAALDAIRQGRWQPSGEAQTPVELNIERPNIFRLYEQNIGPLTPMLAEMLREAEQLYPPEWIEDAIRIAVENNRRSWRYADAILRRWQEKGRDEPKGPDRRDTEKDRRRYAEWDEDN
jgi:DNA replication protein